MWFSLTFPVCSKFPDFSLTGKCLPIFPGFPVRVGTLNTCDFSTFRTAFNPFERLENQWLLMLSSNGSLNCSQAGQVQVQGLGPRSRGDIITHYRTQCYWCRPLYRSLPMPRSGLLRHATYGQHSDGLMFRWVDVRNVRFGYRLRRHKPTISFYCGTFSLRVTVHPNPLHD